MFKFFKRKPKVVKKPLHNCKEAGCIIPSQKNGVNTPVDKDFWCTCVQGPCAIHDK